MSISTQTYSIGTNHIFFVDPNTGELSYEEVVVEKTAEETKELEAKQ